MLATQVTLWILPVVLLVVTTLVLDNKKEIHEALRKLQENELDAALKLLLISVVMFPLLPRQGIGPGQVINLYEIWWMVVLIASVSFMGYFAVRIADPEKGLLFTSVFGGLSSSTATSLHFAVLAGRGARRVGIVRCAVSSSHRIHKKAPRVRGFGVNRD